MVTGNRNSLWFVKFFENVYRFHCQIKYRSLSQAASVNPNEYSFQSFDNPGMDHSSLNNFCFVFTMSNILACQVKNE